MSMMPPQQRPPSNATISASYRNGKLQLPQTTEVKVGSRVAWRIRADRELLWTVYFDHGTPFDTTAREVIAESAEIVLGTAKRAGEYKYGLRIADPQTKTVLDDDDPYLVVTVS